ncbi:hypothetical protein BBJ28_00015079 [Nothophytophthora sp. Chile5]|nr:hypothetical protein BBJ28_00015079 [Nothophytophthora sp. Chile5]
MPGLKEERPPMRADGSDSDGDEAPEVVTKQSAEEQALEQLRHEGEARTKAKADAKRKRKSKQTEKKPEQKEVEELPADILTAEEEAAASARAKRRRAAADAKRAKVMAKKTHTRQFGNIQVQTLDALETTQTRDLSSSAQEFLARRETPHRPRMNVLEGHPSLFTKKQKERSQRV